MADICLARQAQLAGMLESYGTASEGGIDQVDRS